MNRLHELCSRPGCRAPASILQETKKTQSIFLKTQEEQQHLEQQHFLLKTLLLLKILLFLALWPPTAFPCCAALGRKPYALLCH